MFKYCLCVLVLMTTAAFLFAFLTMTCVRRGLVLRRRAYKRKHGVDNICAFFHPYANGLGGGE